MNNDLLYQLALTQVHRIGCVHAKTLVQQFGSAEAIFRAGQSQLETIEGIGTVRAKAIKSFNQFHLLEKEIAFIEKYKISPLFITDKNYPQRLLHCYDPPTLLFYRGSANLNHPRIIAVIGTRNNTDYGKQLTEKLLKALAPLNVLIVSGLAFGIDALAHKQSLKNKLPTVAVLAHGLDTIYPPEHNNLAKEIARHDGGLLTELFSNSKPDKHNFPSRNRIVAGMSDAVVVIETDIIGGSMITAELANGYNKDVFAFPGRTADAKSAGCNYLIKSNKATLITGADDLMEIMGWEEKTVLKKEQKEIFIDLNPVEKIITGLLQQKETVHIDELHIQTGLSNSEMAAAILNLELQNVIHAMPGKIYRLV